MRKVLLMGTMAIDSPNGELWVTFQGSFWKNSWLTNFFVAVNYFYFGSYDWDSFNSPVV